MGNKYYARLAADNIKKNKRVYLPYIITCVLMAAMIYIISSLAGNPDLHTMKKGATVTPTIMTLGTYVTSIFAFIIMFYTNSFITKRRRKEFGLLNILGMEKRHISKLLLIETVYVAAITLVGGLALGVLLDKLMFLSLTKMIGETATLGFHISFSSLGITTLVMLATFVIIYIYTVGRVHLSKPVELLSGSNVGEKEPKTKIIMTLLGAALLAVGYIISIVTEEPTKVLPLFLLAVLCVVFGTYLLFMAGSVALLKFLKKREKFYYKTNHFAAVSGLIYRMKRNAVGLASVCILSTMVLVMVAVTSSMMLGMDRAVKREHPTDVEMNVHSVEAGDEIERLFSEKMDITNISRVSRPAFEVGGDYAAPHPLAASDYIKNTTPDGYTFYSLTEQANANSFRINVYTSDRITYLMEKGDAGYGEDYTVAKGEVIVVTDMPDFTPQSITLAGKSYKVAKTLCYSDSFGMGYDLVMHSREEILELVENFNKVAYQKAEIYETVAFDFVSDDKESENAKIDDIVAEGYDFDKFNGLYYTTQAEEKGRAMEIFGSLFFLGLFLGTLFLVETIMIIYYKQISEGYEVEKRFKIMQNVGMSKREVKRSIRSQILLVFFLPLIVAGAHLTFAFPLIRRLLAQLGLNDTGLYLMCSAGGFIGFALIYTAVYTITAKTYYKIVRN